MRTLFSTILLLFSTLSYTQDDTTTLNFLSQFIIRKYDTSSIYYTDKVDAGMYEYMMKKVLIRRKIKDIGNLNRDKLILTTQEVAYLNQQLSSAKERTWKENLFINSERISSDSTLSFLLRNRKSHLYLFTQPAFIRNNTIALFYVVHLCCGGIYGPVDLSFYRKNGNQWERWLRVEGGAF